MPKKSIPEEQPKAHRGIIAQSITGEMEAAYLDYAMSVITSRALPDVRDGLKPVHRRILYSMRLNGLTSSAKFKKSATVVGDVLGSFHPHGDTAVYESMVKLVQDFTTRYPLVIGQGNFGSIDGDSAAAYRYTEAKMSKMSEEMLRDLEKDTVNWRPNFDGTKKEPIVLPAAVPNLLLMGGLGIAVGMATNIPPHNLREVADATVHLIDNPKATTDDLLKFIQGPDFPMGAIAFDKKAIAHAYANGRGGVVVRGEAEIVENNKGFSIIITSIPFRVNKADMQEKIANLVRDKKIEGIREMRDESTSDIRVVIDLKTGAQPQTVLNKLYKHTQLEDTFHYNMVALVDGVPQTLSLKAILEEYVKHRTEVIRRRTEYDLKKAQDREHILLGLKKALDHIDKIIKLIRAAKDVPTAHAALMKEFKFSEIQAQAILDMRLQKLAGLERKKIEDELAAIQKLIKELEAILKSKVKMMNIIKADLLEIAEKYGDDRRTKIVKGGVKQLNPEDLVPDEESVLVLTKGGYVKRTNPAEYKTQRRGGVGVVDLNTKEEDIVTTLLTTSTHSDLLFFTDAGKVYQAKMYEIPEGRRATKGKSIMNFLPLESEEHVTSVLPVQKEAWDEGDRSLLMVTKEGVVKKSDAISFKDVRRSGLIAISLKEGDSLISASFVAKGDEVSLVTRNGQAIRFTEEDVRQMGRTAAGVAAMKLGKGDHIVSAGILKNGDKDREILIVTELGFGKTTPAKEYKVQKRAGSGIKTAKVTDKTGKIVRGVIITGEDREDGELVIMSKKGQVIKLPLKQVPTLGRDTQGVKVMKMRAGDSIASVVFVPNPEEESE